MVGRLAAICVAGAILAIGTAALAAVNIETVPVGNLGNAGELSGAGAGGEGPDRVCGAVDYQFSMGKYEVTAGQYCEFLNAVAATDTYGLYSIDMDCDASANAYGCEIKRTGIPGSYAYTVATDWADRPVNHVSWGDAARFANWLHNGQPTGAQGPATTENGAYSLQGAMTDAELVAVTRNPGWKWAIPTEDEWYKAAYHANDGVTGSYHDYPTGSDTMPSNQLIDPDPGNNATFCSGGYTIDSPYYRTEVGAHENSDSPYGTFDMGGNVHEWNEAILSVSCRGVRGGSWQYAGEYMQASYRQVRSAPSDQYAVLGFRVSQVPEPGAVCLLALGGLVLLRRRRAA